MLILRVFWAEFRKSLILFMRYPFGSLITVSVMLLLFIGIFETALRVSSVEELSSDQTRLAAQKFVLWTVMILGFSSVAASIKDETQSGFIEVVWMGALHPTIVVFIRSLVSHTISISMCMLIALLLSVLRVSVLLCMTDLAHASKLKEHDDNDDFQGTTGRAA